MTQMIRELTTEEIYFVSGGLNGSGIDWKFDIPLGDVVLKVVADIGHFFDVTFNGKNGGLLSFGMYSNMAYLNLPGFNLMLENNKLGNGVSNLNLESAYFNMNLPINLIW